MQSEDQEFLIRLKIKQVYRNVIVRTSDLNNFELIAFFKKSKLISTKTLITVQQQLGNVFLFLVIPNSVLHAHQIDIENDELNGLETEWYDQFRTPLTPRMIEISLQNFKSWMNTGFFIEINFTVGGSLIQSAEKEVRNLKCYKLLLFGNNYFVDFLESHQFLKCEWR